MTTPSRSPIGQAALSELAAVIRRKLDKGEAPQAIRKRTEAMLTRRLGNRSEHDPARAEILRAHADYQRAVENAIRDWEAEQP